MDLTYYKDLLEEKQKQTLDSIEGLKEAAKPVDLNDPIGRLSRQDALQQQQMSLHNKKQAELTLKQIEAAFKRIEDESYGYCMKCEEEIPENRLRAKPETPFCTGCQK